LAALLSLAACAPTPRGTGDLGIVVGRASGQVVVVDTTARRALSTVDGLGDLSHASAVYSRDERFAYVAGRDGGLSKVDLLTGKLVARVIQAGNSIGLSISEDGKLIAVQNYEPGGVKVFDADNLALLDTTIQPAERETAPPKLAYTIPELCQASGLSRAMVYREIKAERLKVKKVGTRTLVPIDEAKAWMKV
jgi:protein NirF